MGIETLAPRSNETMELKCIAVLVYVRSLFTNEAPLSGAAICWIFHFVLLVPIKIEVAALSATV